MDRNFEGDGATEVEEVALHPEGVDRNTNRLQIVNTLLVALHPEGVDRNVVFVAQLLNRVGRPPPGGRG